MNARSIQRQILLDRWHTHTVFPNFTPTNWFECDVIALSKAGFFLEFEIKISRADFKADAAKAPEISEVSNGQWITRRGESKHQRLARADTAGPSRFFFVTPPNLISTTELPTWAGLIHADRTLQIVKPAPRLHRTKANPQIESDIHTAAYWRFIRLLISPAQEIPEIPKT